MSAAHVKCLCAHPHRGACPHPGCGCLYYRPQRAAISPQVPRVIRGVTERAVRAVSR